MTGRYKTWWVRWNASGFQFNLSDVTISDASGGSACDGLQYDAVYFIYHPHDTWSGSPGATDPDFSDEIVAKKDNYYITYFPLTNASGKADGIVRNEFHLALHSDSGLRGGNKDNIADNAHATDPVVDNLLHCGADNKMSDNSTAASESAIVCGLHWVQSNYALNGWYLP